MKYFKEEDENFLVDEGVDLGGVRSKNEIRILICYLINSVKQPMDKPTVLEAIQQKALANYLETSACFDDLVRHDNLEPIEPGGKFFRLTENGKMIAQQLDFALPESVKEKAYGCAIETLNRQRVEKENAVTIEKTEFGYNVNCKISGGDFDLVSIDIFVPDRAQAKLVKKNFHKNPERLYKEIIGTMTGNREMVKEVVDEVNAELRRKD